MEPILTEILQLVAATIFISCYGFLRSNSGLFNKFTNIIIEILCGASSGFLLLTKKKLNNKQSSLLSVVSIVSFVIFMISPLPNRRLWHYNRIIGPLFDYAQIPLTIFIFMVAHGRRFKNQIIPGFIATISFIVWWSSCLGLLADNNIIKINQDNFEFFASAMFTILWVFARVFKIINPIFSNIMSNTTSISMIGYAFGLLTTRLLLIMNENTPTIHRLGQLVLATSTFLYTFNINKTLSIGAPLLKYGISFLMLITMNMSMTTHNHIMKKKSYGNILRHLIITLYYIATYYKTNNSDGRVVISANLSYVLTTFFYGSQVIDRLISMLETYDRSNLDCRQYGVKNTRDTTNTRDTNTIDTNTIDTNTIDTNTIDTNNDDDTNKDTNNDDDPPLPFTDRIINFAWVTTIYTTLIWRRYYKTPYKYINVIMNLNLISVSLASSGLILTKVGLTLGKQGAQIISILIMLSLILGVVKNIREIFNTVD
uniref:Uncharacterized protein n=1 Tax=Megaviridae environmental sample TaxID=1737588 RepID=A0A5J6VHQ9_9VIRU|nr:MAG: hypothetical protein [Megaviridae environmental sample]